MYHHYENFFDDLHIYLGNKLQIFVIVFIVFSTTKNTAIASEPYRFFTDDNNRSIEAKLLGFQGDKIKIIRKDGRIFILNPNIFSYCDQNYITNFKAKINPKTNKPWNSNDFKSVILKQKWTCNLKPGAYKHILQFELDKIDLDKDDIPDGRKLTYQTSHINKKSASFGTWTVDELGLVETSKGIWKFDKRSGFLIGQIKYSNCCQTLMPYLKQIEFK